MDTIQAFFSKIITLFSIFKKGRGGLCSSPNCTSVNVDEYASVSLNIPKYPWKKYLNWLLWLCQGYEYAWSSYVFNRLLKMSQVINVPGFWIWHDCICKCYKDICLNMAPYTSTMLECSSTCRNIPQNAWTQLNIAECSWICLIKLFWILLLL